MPDFEVPDVNVMFSSAADVTGTSGDELPWVPFSNNEDELGFVSFN